MNIKMKKQIIAKIRYVKGIVFGASAIPNDMDAFRKALLEIDDSKLSEIERSWKSYKLADIFIDFFYHSKFIKKWIYSLMFPGAYLWISCKKKVKFKEKRDVVYYCISSNKGIMPTKYRKISNIQVVSMGEGMMLDKEAKDIIKESFKISRGKLYFLMEELLALANYSYICNKYNPKEIVTTYESSCVNSVLTLYCHKKNVTHINFMHGEKLFSPLNVLGYFDTMYVWDEHYLSLFKKLKYRVNTYVIENPWEGIELPRPLQTVDYTFFLNYENEKSLEKIVDIAKKLMNKDYSIRIRLHPSQLQEERLRNLVPEDMFDNDIKSIMQSISNTRIAISRYSTVLYQAFLNGKVVVIDDITNNEEFKRLQQLDYIMLKKNHKLLSKILEEEGITY